MRPLDVKSCFLGSAPLPVEVLRSFEEVTGAPIVEGFGLTETPPVTHVNPLGRRKVGSIGVPFVETDANGVPDSKRGEIVKSFLVLKAGMIATAEEIQAYCRENVAAYKVPRAVEFRHELPKSPVLKILRRALCDEEVARSKVFYKTG